MSEYITVERNNTLSDLRGRKTDIYDVRSKRSREHIGTIRWFGRWRQYTFWPMFDTTWNPDCLRFIADKCAELTREHRSSGGRPTTETEQHGDTL
jgi:hypothetical protein